MKIAATLLLASLSCAGAFTTIGAAPRSAATMMSATVEDETATTFKGAAAISALTKDVETVFGSTEIDKFLPHRYPFALVDKIVEMEPGKRAVGIKSVTKNEDFFNGHFPGQPVMPGVLQLEALAQLAGCIVANTEGVAEGSVYFFGSADGTKWKKPVIPGDTLVMEVEVLKFNKKFGIIKASGKGYTDGTLAVEVAEMTFAMAR
ncbi:MAG: hypothetical protein SGILL_001473 [Bacillariaceae sp.]